MLIALMQVLSSLHSFAENQVDFQIRFYNSEIYYTDSSILVKAEIINNSPEVFRFRMANNRAFNINFQVRSLRNEPLPPSDRYILHRNSSEKVFFRMLSLEPGESFSVVEDLADYVKLNEPGQLVVQGQFYPELFNGIDSTILASNPLSLNIRPSIREPALVANSVDQMRDILRIEALNPDQVVEYIIESRQLKRWDRFFLYLDLEALYLQHPGNEDRYFASSEEGRMRLLKEYKERLSSESIDFDILLTPSEFRILKTSYTDQEGEVVVLEKFGYTGFTEIKEYTYFLAKKLGVWYVTGYKVRNLGTE